MHVAYYISTGSPELSIPRTRPFPTELPSSESPIETEDNFHILHDHLTLDNTKVNNIIKN